MRSQNGGLYAGMTCKGFVMVAGFGQPCGHEKQKGGSLDMHQYLIGCACSLERQEQALEQALCSLKVTCILSVMCWLALQLLLTNSPAPLPDLSRYLTCLSKLAAS